MSTTTTYHLPPFVYKILPAPPPSPIPDVLPLSDLDRKDGFIHLSTASQIPITASLYFTSATALWLLKLDTRKTLAQGGVYKWVEDLPGCPHLYAPKEGEWIDLGRENVVGERAVKRGEGQTWEDAFVGLKEEGWLVDE
ncbi:hypothetical protein C8Q76DRAFT_634848 [Earliella scabrosa]|nr:hypothetical protein C8Q76DRAFT_634848 [Earliella scabrosa]